MAVSPSSAARSAPSSTRCGGRSQARGPISAGELSDGGKGQRILVGLERRQAGARMAVLGRRGDHRHPARLRAHLRSARARAAGRDPERADARPRTRRSAACCALSIRALGDRQRALPARLFPARARRTRRRASRNSWKRASLLPVAVEGWDGPVYLDPQARVPRTIDGAGAPVAVRSHRVGAHAHASACSISATGSRSTRPAEKREFGYYCLPFLLGEIASWRALDLKADRAHRAAVGASIHPEAEAPPRRSRAGT